MPGSGTQSGGNSGIPGSGTGYYPGASSWTPGSQIQPLPTSGAGNPHPSGSFPGGTSGGGGSASNHFDASLGSDGSITINLPGAEGVSAGDPSSAISLIFQKYKKIAAVITGICVITAILSLLIQITKLGAAGDNERMRAMALKGIIFSDLLLLYLVLWRQLLASSGTHLYKLSDLMDMKGGPKQFLFGCPNRKLRGKFYEENKDF